MTERRKPTKHRTEKSSTSGNYNRVPKAKRGYSQRGPRGAR